MELFSYRIHGTGIFAYICLFFLLHVGKYTMHMDSYGIYVCWIGKQKHVYECACERSTHGG